MIKKVVLFNIETNEYFQGSRNTICTTKEWQNANKYDAEILALDDLHTNKLRLMKLNLRNWCTRTFYTLG